MTMWERMRAFARKRWRAVIDRDDWIALAWMDGDGRAVQTVQLRRLSVGGREHVLLLADICAAALLRPEALPELNLHVASGALVVAGDLVLLRQLLPLEACEPRVLESAVSSLGADAGRLRARLPRSFRHEAPTEMFAAFAE